MAHWRCSLTLNAEKCCKIIAKVKLQNLKQPKSHHEHCIKGVEWLPELWKWGLIFPQNDWLFLIMNNVIFMTLMGEWHRSCSMLTNLNVLAFSRNVANEAACYQVKQLILRWFTVGVWVNSYPADYVKNYLYYRSIWTVWMLECCLCNCLTIWVIDKLWNLLPGASCLASRWCKADCLVLISIKSEVSFIFSHFQITPHSLAHYKHCPESLMQRPASHSFTWHKSVKVN